MRTYTKNLKLFKSTFERVQNFLANNKIRIQKYEDGEYFFICDLTYEKNICFFSTRNENLMNEITDYLTGNNYQVSTQ